MNEWMKNECGLVKTEWRDQWKQMMAVVQWQMSREEEDRREEEEAFW